MVTIKEKLKLISLCLGSLQVSSSGDNANVVCPVCEASGKITSKKKLSINLDKGIYHCWVCNSKGRNIGRLCLKYSNQSDAAKSLIEVYKKDSDDTKEEEKIQIKPLLPEDFKLLYNMKNSKVFGKHYQYLVDRGFTELKMKKFRVGASLSYDYQNKVIFPSFDEKCELNYFVSRTIIPGEKYRYKNFEGSRKDVIFRHVDLDFNKTMILTEGVFDLVNCPQNSTCVLGSWIDINYKIFREIVKHKTPVVICFDPDAREKSLKIARALNEYCVEVKLSQHLEKDFGDMTECEVKYFIDSAKRFDNANFVRYLIGNISSGSMF